MNRFEWQSAMNDGRKITIGFNPRLQKEEESKFDHWNRTASDWWGVVIGVLLGLSVVALVLLTK